MEEADERGLHVTVFLGKNNRADLLLGVLVTLLLSSCVAFGQF